MKDYISRADAIDAVFGLTQINGRVPTDSVIFQIKALPSADAVQGEWNKFDTGIYLCSNCNWAVGNEYNYCPCCGTKMVKGGDDE